MKEKKEEDKYEKLPTATNACMNKNAKPNKRAFANS